ncbi:hypothetical protein DMP06_06320 [Slackia equolifaciens]|uniref:Uncharacterized protein n=1 Tax=Slackia equolifaciens TaxID=498718 RepID=A0A3N0AYI9_9ACTN|nr:hypothetical protein [Slackia equolifaciens]RNL39945.1 hypothetical protein DMP06_06320 [Slackia equolifaciens]
MKEDVNLLWFLGKLHEVFSYGFIAAIACLAIGITNTESLLSSAFQPTGIPGFFLFYLFWTLVGFIPISIICAFATKYADGGQGLLFQSDSIVIIMFGHFFEDICGIIATPFWFLKDLFTHELGGWKTVDYIIYLLIVVFVAIGIISLVLT